ncbi:hypothetical protein HQN89_19100 [Paenibacillus frigoriresistens]|uniref:SGNH/GDSL hydrolase N-terminal domain-containing protein n=1 Tax=Paenibacillus alginolyticus TaxID=59839 RepID=UPI001565D3BD|nr:SGNH/GDSL hydrolase N-terminal domain-containing protein [Paenibacillus frigoriresistens]NRF93083.1 hypothetical protein [Paenibacillus frigoriresistens]
MKDWSRLANFTAGVQIHFQTDSPKLSVRVVLADKANMYQMPATGQCGVDCYIGSHGKQQFVIVTRSTLRFRNMKPFFLNRLEIK